LLTLAQYKSLLTFGIIESLPSENAKNIFEAEIRWHYSQHYFAECRGEEIIEDLAKLTYGRKQRNLLHSQLVDEKRHVKLFSNLIGQIGLDERANRFSDGYSSVVKAQNTLAEKVFAFQILTEAVSAAYCAWRLTAMSEIGFPTIDQEVLEDESRHLGMGRSMLEICDPDESTSVLSTTRKRQLVKEINAICYEATNIDMQKALLGEGPANNVPPYNTLNRLVSRTVLRESGVTIGSISLL
jgi:rubrerythrin